MRVISLKSIKALARQVTRFRDMLTYIQCGGCDSVWDHWSRENHERGCKVGHARKVLKTFKKALSNV